MIKSHLLPKLPEFLETGPLDVADLTLFAIFAFADPELETDNEEDGPRIGFVGEFDF